MKQMFFASTAVASLMMAASSVAAGNMSEPVMEPAPMPAPAPMPMQTSANWSGFYAGGSLGYATVDDDAATFGDGFEGLTYGVHAGYDYDFGSFVMGGEIEISSFDVTDNETATSVDSVSRLKVRAGYDAGDVLPYLTAGVAQLNTSGAPLGDVDDTGAFYGLGMDYRIGSNLRVGGEVLQHEFDDYAGSGINADALTAGLRVSFEF